MTYDLIILGGGPAGYLAAERAGHAGLNTLIIEKRSFGGVCLNEGCIPSKTLLHSAKIYDYARFSEKYGVISENVTFDHEKVIKRKNKVVKTLVSGVEFKLKSNKVEMIKAEGLIKEKNQNGFNVKADGKTYEGTRLLIATGSSAFVPPIPGAKEGLENGFVLTNREVLDLNEVPENLVVVGGGVIGLEMASYFNSAGSKVTVIEMLDHIAGMTDKDISKLLMKGYEKKGIEFKLSAKDVNITEDSVEYEKDGEKNSVKANKVLMSIGRRPNTSGIGLENIGVYTEKGSIVVDEKGKTNVVNVYAAGDVNGKSMLAHTSYRETEGCINNILEKKRIIK